LPDDARCSIQQAQKTGSLICVSEDDLLAPYRKTESQNHEALCGALKEHFAISLSLRDFCVEDGEGEEGPYFTRALNFAKVSEQDRLMVVTCNYILHERDDSQDFPRFTIAPDSINFHLLEAV